MVLSVSLCVVSFAFLIALLRRKQISLGMPIAYLASLLLIHVPGAVAHILDSNRILTGREFTEIGIAFTAIGTVCFVIGVAIAQSRGGEVVPKRASRTLFWNFCLYGGFVVTTIGFLISIASFVALFRNSGQIWMLGVILGLRSAMRRRDLSASWVWLAVLTIYPLLMLLLGGFLSYGSTAVILVLSGVVVTARSGFRVTLATALTVVVGISVFLGYFQNRNQIRAAVWGGEGTDARIHASLNAVKDVALFDPSDPKHLQAFDARLNQNYFVGLAAARLETGKVEYLKGRSLWEGLQAMIPRALWPDKSVVGGSPMIVAEMTGLQLSRGTSFGVGNVMEFHINFGIPGIIFGFLLLGWVLGTLDRRAAESDARGELGKVMLFFLPAVALIQPNGSIVEMMGGGTAALAGAFAFKWAWGRWPKPLRRPRILAGELIRTAP